MTSDTLDHTGTRPARHAVPRPPRRGHARRFARIPRDQPVGATLISEGADDGTLAGILAAGRFDPDQTTVVLRASTLGDVGRLDGIERLCIEQGVRPRTAHHRAVTSVRWAIRTRGRP